MPAASGGAQDGEETDAKQRQEQQRPQPLVLGVERPAHAENVSSVPT